MPYSGRPGAARRDASLLRLRRLSLGIAGGAAGAALSLGVAFAHALPGHAADSGHQSGVTGTGQHQAGVAQPSSKPAAGAGHRNHHQHLSAPARAPAPSPAPPVVSSGGS